MKMKEKKGKKVSCVGQFVDSLIGDRVKHIS